MIIVATLGASTLVQAGDGSPEEQREVAATRGGVGKFFPIDPATDSAEKSSAQAWAEGAFLGKAVPHAPKSLLDASRPPFSFTYGGKSSREFLASWKTKAIDVAAADGRQKHTITYTDPVSGLQVVCEVSRFADYRAVDWVLYFRNTGKANTPILEDIRPLDLGIASLADASVILHRGNGSRCAPTDFLPIDQPVAVNAEINLAPIGGRSSDGVLPFFNLQWNGGGLVGAIGWSGQWAMRLHRETGGAVTLQAGQQLTHFTLHPGESVRTPRILLTLWQGNDPLRGHNLFRRLLIAHYLPKRNGEVAIAPLTWMTWMAFNQGQVNEENQLDWIARTAKTGMEGYWLDAGWFEGGFPNGAGSWVPDAKKFPRGLKPIGDAARTAGMPFVLWFEPERVATNSSIAREHPEFVLKCKTPANDPTCQMPGDLFNLGDPAARVWLTDYLSKCFSDWGVDIFRNDFNIDPLRFWREADAPDRQGITEIRYIEGLYQLLDDLVRRRPGLTIDNCASGGRRIDLETTSRSYPLWRSDIQCYGKATPVPDQIQTAGLSLYVPQHTAGAWAFDPYSFRSVATMGVSLCPDIRNKDLPLDVVKRAMGEVKELRPLYFGDYYPLFAINDSEQAWCGWQFDRPELGHGFGMVFRRAKAANAVADVKLHGLNPQSMYEVEFRDSYAAKKKAKMTGAALAQQRIEIGSAPGSLLILYRVITVEVAPVDDTAPTLLDVIPPVSSDRVMLTFSEPVQQADAETIANYTIIPGVQVLAVSLGTDRKTVTLTIAPLSGGQYTLKVKNIRDCARKPNLIAANTSKAFGYSPLFARWKLDEGKGLVAADVGRSKLEGALKGGVTWPNTAGRKALSFDGAGGIVEIPTKLEDLALPFSFTFWVNPAAEQVEYADILGNHGGTAYGLVMQQDGNKTNLFGFVYGDGKQYYGVGSAQLTAGQWQHVAVVCDGSKAFFCVNGEVKSSGAAAGVFAPNPGLMFRLGQGFEQSGRCFRGLLSDVRIYRMALSPAEVQVVMKE
jgi:alpha-galactosidase